MKLFGSPKLPFQGAQRQIQIELTSRRRFLTSDVSCQIFILHKPVQGGFTVRANIFLRLPNCKDDPFFFLIHALNAFGVHLGQGMGSDKNVVSSFSWYIHAHPVPSHCWHKSASGMPNRGSGVGSGSVMVVTPIQTAFLHQ